MRCFLNPIKTLLLTLAVSVQVSGMFAAGAETNPPQRIVSMAPSTTEMLFAIGAGENVVGVTRYCDYPTSATALAEVGGFVDPNYEQIVALQSDMVVLLTSHRDARVELEKLRISTIIVPETTVGDIHEAISIIGEAAGEREGADALLADLNSRSEVVMLAVEEQPRPKVLICIGRDTESGQLAGMYVAGRNGFYDEIIEMAGGMNAYRDEQVAYPQLSAEGILQLNPDVIIDLVSEIDEDGKQPEEIARQWGQLRMVSAVRNNRVHVVVGSNRPSQTILPSAPR